MRVKRSIPILERLNEELEVEAREPREERDRVANARGLEHTEVEVVTRGLPPRDADVDRVGVAPDGRAPEERVAGVDEVRTQRADRQPVRR